MNNDEIFVRATEWLLRMEHPSREDRVEFWKWLLKSPRHTWAYLRAKREHSTVDGIIRGRRFDMSPDPSAEVDADELRYPAWKIAAGIAFVAVMIATFQYFSEDSVRTAAGESDREQLADGTVVIAGPRTELYTEFSDEQRIVHLVSGEAMFRVAPNHARPFLVVTSRATARAVGTAFAVSLLYEKGPLITVEEGEVAVTRRTQSAAAGESVTLRAGQQVQVTESSSLTVARVNLREELGWVRGSFLFPGGTRVADAVDDFNLRNEVQIVIAEGSRVGEEQLRGGFRTTKPEEFVKFLEDNEIASVVRDDPDTLLLVPYRGPAQ